VQFYMLHAPRRGSDAPFVLYCICGYWFVPSVLKVLCPLYYNKSTVLFRAHCCAGQAEAPCGDGAPADGRESEGGSDIY